jgi:hypothetical protein
VTPDVANDGHVIEAYYDPAKKLYWVPNARAESIEINEPSLRRRLRMAGLRNKVAEGELVSEVDRKITEIQDHHDVAYAGPLAGHHGGLLDSGGKRILVTDSPKLIEPVEGEWRILYALLEGLLDDGTYDQRPYLYGWLKVACEALSSRLLRPGQLMGLCGPRNCGKSLLQNLFTLLFGGRAAKPYRYMKGGTEFNADLFGAEHLMIEDEHCSTDIRARRQFGAQIKQFTVNRDQSCHDKGRRALTLAPFWRVSLSVNDEPEAMMVLPPMGDSDEDSLSDKVYLVRTRKAEMPMPTRDAVERDAFWKTLKSELPGFRYFLKNWEIPTQLRCGRFGIKTWHHPALLAALDSLAPETRLLALIDAVLFYDRDLPGVVSADARKEWIGTAEDLEGCLCNSSLAYEARRLLGWSFAAGAYLGRLERKGERVERYRSSDLRMWRIVAPGQPLAVRKAA